MIPPRSSQPLQLEPFHHLCHMWLSVPRTKQSSRFEPQEETAGADVQTPPRFSHPLQLDPFHHLCHIAMSVPRTKQSMRFGPHETAAGALVRIPPRSSHPLQLEPFHHLCHMWLSVPRTKQSSRFDAQDETAGSLVQTPPRFSHPSQVISCRPSSPAPAPPCHRTACHPARLLPPLGRLDHLAAGHLLRLGICHVRSSSPLNAAVRSVTREAADPAPSVATRDGRTPRRSCQSPQKG